ncbi:hypothetical protein Gorai_006864 [Gossypium raimondii]|uniref:Uncharacterized protein n=1 Tax=Gossypium raimondii TaxID=29730 RepID=A0A7J8Q6H9_GOSRA|nr:hypothetical protein [Gossypium raimondii]
MFPSKILRNTRSNTRFIDWWLIEIQNLPISLR